MKNIFLFVLILVAFSNRVNSYLDLDWDVKNPAFDPEFYEQFLNPDLCTQQLAFIRNETLLAMQFIESGLRLPRSILEGNVVDLGNYFQCINIDHQGVNLNENIEGKYCLIQVPWNQEIQVPDLPSLPELPGIEWPEWLPELPIDFDHTKFSHNEKIVKKIEFANKVELGVKAVNGHHINSRSVAGTASENVNFRLALCVPKVCTTKQWMEGFFLNTTAVGLRYNDEFCRVKDDKPWAPVDYVAIVVFSILGFVTLLSTSYDIWHTFIIKTDLKTINPLHRCFSLYTNGQRLTTFRKLPGNLECVDGIRALSMAWVILGHTFSTLPPTQNLLESIDWTLSFRSTWVTAAPISVDTFFMLSGLLLVYTTAGKLTGVKLLKNLHFFYLNRLLRMFPLLAAGVLVQASFLYRLADGPISYSAKYTEDCRSYWWSTLLYFQNYANTWNMCLPHSWYLAIDMHMHILSPLILFWVLNGKKTASWIVLIGALIAWLVASTTYNFMNEFSGAVITATRSGEHQNYMQYYYLNTLTRAPPFFVGLIFGYLLHLTKGNKVQMTKITSSILWICALSMVAIGIISGHPMKSQDWDNQTVDSLMNSFARSLWAIGIGWIIFACARDLRAGPINWILSHKIFKLPSRLSYAMYIFHYPLMYVTAGTAMAPYYFTEMRTMYRFFSELSVALVLAFCLTVFIDSPFSTIFKLVLGGGAKKPSSHPNKDMKDIVISNNYNNNIEKEKYREKL